MTENDKAINNEMIINNKTPLSLLTLSKAAVDLLTDNGIDSVEQLYETKFSSLKGTENLSEADLDMVKHITVPDKEYYDIINEKGHRIPPAIAKKKNEKKQQPKVIKDDPSRKILRFGKEHPTREDVLNAIAEKQTSFEQRIGLYIPTPVEEFYLDPNRYTFKNISKNEQTYGDVALALSVDPRCIHDVSKKLITEELCIPLLEKDPSLLCAIPQEKRSYNMCMLCLKKDPSTVEYVPPEYLDEELCMGLLEHDPSLFRLLPEEHITYSMCEIVVEKCPRLIRRIPDSIMSEELCDRALAIENSNIQFVPSKYITDKMLMSLIGNDPFIIDKFPPNYVTNRRILKAVELNGLVLQVVNPKKITQEIATVAVQNNRKAIDYIPDQLLDDSKFVKDIGLSKNEINEIKKRRDDIINEKDGLTDSENTRPDLAHSFDNDAFSSPQIVLKKDFNPRRIDFPILSDSELPAELVVSGDARIVTVDESDEYQGRIYYISDLHIEHQIQEYFNEEQVNDRFIVQCIDRKIRTMNIPSSTPNDILLIAGDTADSPGFVNVFLNKLRFCWQGTILLVLGNHEIWYRKEFRHDPIDACVDMYRSVIDKSGRVSGMSCLLQNSLYIRYKNNKEFVITEEQILDATDEELGDVISKSTAIVLGGIGFSGYWEGAIDWYDGVLDKESIKSQTTRFLNIYNKILRCSGEKRVIVLTHFPFPNWNPARDEKGSPAYNDDWIYVNGHTHNNFAFRTNNNAWVFANNQIGYEPSNWRLKSFLIKDWYDALSAYDDGIHTISKDQYAEFNFGRGIQCKGCSYPGEIIMLKRKGIYMFLLKGKRSLCILNGGQRKTAEKDVEYYFNNMLEYSDRLMTIMTPGRNMLKKIAKEIKRFGGLGRVHGSIIDISDECHIHIDFQTGEPKIYYEPFGFAAMFSITGREVYDSVDHLISSHELGLWRDYKELRDNGSLPLIGELEERHPLIGEKQMEFGNEFRSDSPLVRRVQYLFENNVIRMWNDDILAIDVDEMNKARGLIEQMSVEEDDF